MKCQTNGVSTVLDTETIVMNYFFTVKGTSRYPQLYQYEAILKKWEKKLSFYPQFVTYELDSIGKLHIHGIAQARHNYLLRRLNKKKYSIDVRPLVCAEEYTRAHKYCYKEPHNQNPYAQQEFLTSYLIRTDPYPFIADKPRDAGGVPACNKVEQANE